MSVFMGEAAPHASQLDALGLPVELAEPAWVGLVDDQRWAKRHLFVEEG